MPAQQAKSPLVAKYGAKLHGAVAKHAKDETRYSQFGDLPGGITNGIAQLTDCRFAQVAAGKQNAGEYYFYAAGTVISPEEHNGIPVKGLRTSQMEMVCDTATQAGKITTQEQHIDNILNLMRRLAGDEFTAEAEGPNAGYHLEPLAARLKEAAPYFRFSTREGKATKEFPNPRVFHEWLGIKGLENWSPSDDGQAAVDDQSGAPIDNGAIATEGTDAADTGAGTDPDADGALTELANQADGGDADAANRLGELAIAAGIAEADVTATNNWGEVVALMRQAAGFAAEESEPAQAAEPEPEPFVPAKGEHYKYRPMDAKTKKLVKKGIECEVQAVDKKAETVQLLNRENKKTVYKAVPWDRLEAVE